MLKHSVHLRWYITTAKFKTENFSENFVEPPHGKPPYGPKSPIVEVVQDTEDAQEEIQKVEIERDCTHNILIRR